MLGVAWAPLGLAEEAPGCVRKEQPWTPLREAETGTSHLGPFLMGADGGTPPVPLPLHSDSHTLLPEGPYQEYPLLQGPGRGSLCPPTRGQVQVLEALG